MGVLRPFYINRRATELKGFVMGFLIFFFELDDSSGQTLWDCLNSGEHGLSSGSSERTNPSVMGRYFNGVFQKAPFSNESIGRRILASNTIESYA